MHLNFIKKPLLFISFIFITTQIFAATITWTGGAGVKSNLWSKPANWDLLIVPAAGDDVIIPAGKGLVKYDIADGYFKTISIDVNSGLTIMVGRKLQLIEAVANAVTIDGSLTNRGTLVVNNTTSTGIFNRGTMYNYGLLTMDNHANIALYNEGTFQNELDGEVEILLVGGVNISSNGPLINEGSIVLMREGTGNGIHVGDFFDNRATGTITFGSGHPGYFWAYGNSMTNNGKITLAGTTNFEYCFRMNSASQLTNGSTGEIFINGFSVIAGLYISSGSTLTNDGEITILNDGTRTAIQLSNSTLLNNTGSRIDLENLETGMELFVLGAFENHGLFNGLNLETAIENGAVIDNMEDGELLIENTETGIVNSAVATFTNRGGSVSFAGMESHDVINEGTFLNKACGVFYHDKVVDNNGGIYRNRAWIYCLDDGDDHTYTGNLLRNNGMIIDPFDRFGTMVDNQRVRATTLVNPQVNVAYPNALDVVSTAFSDVDDFYTDPALTNLAGTYDFATNIYTPNIDALGATTLYAKTFLVDCTKVISIKIEGAVQPLVADPTHQLSAQVKAIAPQGKLQIYPNPSTTGVFQLDLPYFVEGHLQLQVMDVNGRQVWQQTSANTATLQLDLSDQLANGIYQIQVRRGAEMIGQERLLIQGQ